MCACVSVFAHVSISLFPLVLFISLSSLFLSLGVPYTDFSSGLRHGSSSEGVLVTSQFTRQKDSGISRYLMLQTPSGTGLVVNCRTIFRDLCIFSTTCQWTELRDLTSPVTGTKCCRVMFWKNMLISRAQRVAVQ